MTALAGTDDVQGVVVGSRGPRALGGLGKRHAHEAHAPALVVRSRA